MSLAQQLQVSKAPQAAARSARICNLRSKPDGILSFVSYGGSFFGSFTHLLSEIVPSPQRGHVLRKNH